MNLFPDATVFVQIANFLLLLLILNFMLFRPIRNIISKRDQEISGLEKSLEDLEELYGLKEKNIEEKMVLARKEGFTAKEKLKSEATEEENSIFKKASSAIEDKKEQIHKEMESKMADIRKALEAELAGFTNEIAEKILGRSIQ